MPTVRRLPAYLRLLRDAKESGLQYVSSTLIAEKLQLEPIQVRKDLAAMGITGQPRLGFAASGLIDAIVNFLGWNNTADAFIIGAGNLGSALAGYSGFGDYGLNIVAAFDTDEKKIGKMIHGKEVFPLERLIRLAKRMHVHIAILTLPAAAAQSTAQWLVEAGIRAIWNFTPVKLVVPDGIIVERVDLAASLAVLSRSLREHITSSLGAV